MSLTNALENETANEAFCKFSYLKCRRIKKTSWFVNRPRKCFLTFFLNATSCANINTFRGYRSEPKNIPGDGVLPYRDYESMCGPKGYGFSAVLVIKRAMFLCSSLDMGTFSRSPFFIIIDPWIHLEEGICTWANIRELNKTFCEQSISAIVT